MNRYQWKYLTNEKKRTDIEGQLHFLKPRNLQEQTLPIGLVGDRKIKHIYFECKKLVAHFKVHARAQPRNP